MSFARRAMQLETALRLPAVAMQLSNGGEDVRVARHERAEADREQDGDGQRQDAAFRYVFQNGRGTPIGRWCPVSGTSRHALSVQ
jgi:hypothetical protein